MTGKLEQENIEKENEVGLQEQEYSELQCHMSNEMFTNVENLRHHIRKKYFHCVIVLEWEMISKGIKRNVVFVNNVKKRNAMKIAWKIQQRKQIEEKEENVREEKNSILDSVFYILLIPWYIFLYHHAINTHTQTVKARDLKFWDNVHHTICVMCPVSHVGPLKSEGFWGFV